MFFKLGTDGHVQYWAKTAEAGAVELEPAEAEKITGSPYPPGAWVVSNGVATLDDVVAAELDRNTSALTKINATKAEGLRRISEAVPAFNTLHDVELIASLWPMLDSTAASAAMLLARDTYVYARQQIEFLRTATQEEIDAYDPMTDPDWPS